MLFVVIASAARQSRCRRLCGDEIAAAPAAPRNDDHYRASFFLDERNKAAKVAKGQSSVFIDRPVVAGLRQQRHFPARRRATEGWPNQLFERHLGRADVVAGWKNEIGIPENSTLALHGCFAEDVPRRETVLCHDKASGFRASQSKADGAGAHI